MDRKYVYLSMLLCGAVFLAVGISAPFLFLRYAGQNTMTGIIGGADVPTLGYTVFHVMEGSPFCAALIGITLIVSATFCFLFKKTIQDCCTGKTTLISLGASAVCALGLVCAILWSSIVSFHEISKHPVTYPTSIILGSVCFVTFFLLVVTYGKVRRDRWSVKGLAIDVLTGFVYLPSFFFLFSFLSAILR